MGFDWLPAKNYKRHYICLECKKGFKRPSKKDMKNPVDSDLSNLMEDYYSSENTQDIVQYITEAYQKLNVVCPNCSNPMLQVHYNFEVSPQRDYKAWKKLRENLSSKTTISYKYYVHWHKLQLQEVNKNSEKYNLLKQNLEKLKKYI